MIQELRVMKLYPRKWNNEKSIAPTNEKNEKNITCKAQNFYALLHFLQITITLLIAVSIYCYLIKYQAKRKTFMIILRHK